jgi:chromosome segregation ATPase
MGQQIDPRFAPGKIEEAINNLIANGKPLNACRVRDELGGGDHERIKEALRIYSKKAAQAHQSMNNSSILPPEMEDTVNNLKTNFNIQLDRLAKSCFDVAINTADLRVKSKIDEYNDEISSLEKAEKDAFESIERRDQVNQDLLKKIEQLESKNEGFVAKNAELNALLLIAKEQTAKLESKENEIAHLRQQLGKLEGKLELLEK